MPTPRLLSSKDAAAYLGITERHLRELIYRRELAPTKVGRLNRFDVRLLDRYITANTDLAS
jgi:excisionase family DNA binding protein